MIQFPYTYIALTVHYARNQFSVMFGCQANLNKQIYMYMAYTYIMRREFELWLRDL